MKTITKKEQRGSFKLRAVLFILQILLPFGLYLALESDRPLAAGMIAAVFIISMVVLVWLG